MKKLLKRLRFAVHFRVWPWAIPESVLLYITLDDPPTEADLARGEELAEKFGWD